MKSKFKQISIILSILGICIILTQYINSKQNTDIKELRNRIELLETSREVKEIKKTCKQYTIEEFRNGDAPEKCASEIYGDQF